MALIARSNARWRNLFLFGFCLLFSLSVAVIATAQTATYRLHREASTTTNLFQLKPGNPDAAVLAIQSANLKNVAAGEYVIKQFDTQSGVPNASGTIPAGSTITFELWMRKTSSGGTMFPSVKLNLNSAAGTLLGTATSATALTSTLTKYTISTTTSANVAMGAADRFYVWVGVTVTTAPTANTNAELDIEGVAGGNYDSLVTIPLPAPAPTITNISPAVGPTGTSVTITGANFGATQGSSTVKFNGVTATATSWSSTSIACLAPPGATTGPVVVTVGAAASNGFTFTVAEVGTISGTVSRTSDATGINNALVEALQSGVVKGSTASSADGAYSITGLLSGTYDVRASAPRYFPQIQSGLVVSAPNSTLANFSLVDAGPITNVYDELGRLVAVTDPAGDTVTYKYDAVGNLLSISRSLSSQLSIIEFTPRKGSSGTPVTIYGTGFSATPGDNLIKFNGTAATVTASSSTQISTSVPAGATTGLITITTAAGTVTSSTPFTVGSDVPVITSFTPNIGSPGTTVNISGSNFETTPSGNRVSFNSTRSVVTAATATSLTTTVPTGATSGRISNTTPNGMGAGSDYFFVPPGSLTAADVAVTSVMAIGESKTVSIPTANKIAMVLFEGTTGQRISMTITGVTMGSTGIGIYKPNGALLASITVSNSGGFIETQTLPATGTYTILVDPSSTNTGSLTLNLFGVNDVISTITAGGPSVIASVTTPGQSVWLKFSGTAGQRVSIKATSAFSTCLTLGLYPATGAPIAFQTSCSATSLVEPQTLPETGNYWVYVDPTGSVTGQATINLYTVVDLWGTIDFGGPTVPVTIDTPGQNSWLTFVGTPGQRASVLGTSTFNGCWNLSIFKPDKTLFSNTFSCSSTILLEPQSLPDAGTYYVGTDPSGVTLGSANITLKDVTDVTGPIVINGPSVNVPLLTPGQNGRLTFEGNAGQRVSANGVSNFSGCWNYGIYKPDGALLANTSSCGNNIFLEPRILPVNGTYTLVVDPTGTSTGQMTANVYEVVDVAGTITPNGPSVPVSLPTPGQVARLTFDATAGQRISLQGSSTFTGCWALAILQPDGTQLASSSTCGSSIFIDTQTLPATGTYTLLVDPTGAATGQMAATLHDIADVTGPIILNGPSVPISLPRPGQTARLTFEGTAGQRISILGSSNFTTCLGFVILKPDGTQLMTTSSCSSTPFIEPQTLPVNGTFTLVIDPSGTGTGSATVAAYDVVDVIGSATIGGSPVSATLPTPGQTARLTFNGTAGQRVSFNSTASINGCWALTVLKPDGSQQTTASSCGSSIFIEPQTLAASGAYTVVVDPSLGATGQATVSLYNVVDTTGTLTINGPPINVSISVPGQNASFTFSGTAGQQATGRFASNTAGCVRLTLLKPDGTSLVSNSTCGSTLNLVTQTLPVSGTYTVTVDPSGAGTGSLNVSVTNP